MWTFVEGSSGNAKLFPYGAVIGGTVGSLAILVAVVALCKWDPVHKRLPFDPFSIFNIGGNEGMLSALMWPGHKVEFVGTEFEITLLTVLLVL